MRLLLWIDDLEYVQSVFSKVFPGPQMPWHNNSLLQLQDMYNQVYSHLIGNSKDRDTILQVFCQCLISEGMTSDVDILGTPANSSSPNRIAAILGLEPRNIRYYLGPNPWLIKVGEMDQDIKIDNPFLRNFLLDHSRSYGLLIDLDNARLTLKLAAPSRKAFGAEGM